jgi:hypothetical protein
MARVRVVSTGCFHFSLLLCDCLPIGPLGYSRPGESRLLRDSITPQSTPGDNLKGQRIFGNMIISQELHKNSFI